jgi:8-amino-7-oxononanoate synthase
VRGKPEVISTGTWHRDDVGRAGTETAARGGPLGAATGAASVAVARTAVDILHHQPEQPGFAPDRRSVSAGRGGPRLTARANVSSDDLAVIRHALTAVAEVKVSA